MNKIIIGLLFIISLTINMNIVSADLMTISPDSDNFISQRFPDSNFDNNNLQVTSWKSGGAQYNERSIVRFNLSLIPTNSIINNATLGLYYAGYGTTPPTGRTYNVYSIITSKSNIWVESTITWNKYNGVLSWNTAGGDYNLTPISSSVIPSSYNWVNWTVKTHLTNSINNSVSLSLLIKDSSEGGSHTTGVFYDRNNLTNYPKLIINYTPPSSSNNGYIPPTPTLLSYITGTNWINVSWQKGNGNITNSFNYSVNSIWTNGTLNSYSNLTGMNYYDWHNVTVWAYNNSKGNISITPFINNSQLIPTPTPTPTPTPCVHGNCKKNIFLSWY